MRELVRVGLVVQTGREKIGRHAFAVYDTIGRPLRIDRRRAHGSPHMTKVAGGILRLAQRDYARSQKDRAVVLDGPGRNLWVARAQGWLTDAELAAVNERSSSTPASPATSVPRPSARSCSSPITSVPASRSNPARPAHPRTAGLKRGARKARIAEGRAFGRRDATRSGRDERHALAGRVAEKETARQHAGDPVERRQERGDVAG